MRYLSPVLVLVLFAAPGKTQSTPQHPLPPRPGADVGSSASIVPPNEPGEPLVIDEKCSLQTAPSPFREFTFTLTTPTPKAITLRMVGSIPRVSRDG